MVDHVTTSADEGEYLYGFNSPVEAGNMVTQIMRKKYEPEDKTTKFDMYYLAYQMVVFHNNNNMEDAKNSVEVITSGIDGYFSQCRDVREERLGRTRNLVESNTNGPLTIIHE
jgi:hypothetical protein